METVEHDPELEALLGPVGLDEDGPDLDALFEGVKGRVSQAEESPAYRLKTQPTSRRRLLGVVAFLLVLLVSLATGRREDFADYPPALLALTMGSMGVLFALSLFVALRPIHRPPLPSWQTSGLALLSVLATCALAVAPGLRDHVIARPEEGASLLAHASPCMVYGFLFGLPVYAALRFLDRGASFIARLLAASAAGLAGNMILEIHCPVGGSTHLLAGHAMVVVVYVAGVLGLELVFRRSER